MDFWKRLGRLVASNRIEIDRPKGSVHPRYPDTIYPLDYGYVCDTTAGDGDAIDVWRGTMPGAALVGIVCTVDEVKRDAEIKLLVGCTRSEIETVSRFFNDSESMSAIVVPNDAPGARRPH